MNAYSYHSVSSKINAIKKSVNFPFKILMSLLFSFLSKNRFALIHVSMIHIYNKKKAKAIIFQHRLFCLVL